MRRLSYLIRTADLRLRWALQDMYFRAVCGTIGCNWLLERGMPSICNRCGRSHPVARRRAARDRQHALVDRMYLGMHEEVNV